MNRTNPVAAFRGIGIYRLFFHHKNNTSSFSKIGPSLVAQMVESACNAGDQGSIPGSGRSPREENGNPLQYSCLEKSHGLRILVGYSPWGIKELDTTEKLRFLSFFLLAQNPVWIQWHFCEFYVISLNIYWIILHFYCVRHCAEIQRVGSDLLKNI